MTSQHIVAEPVERCPGGGHRASQRVAPLQRNERARRLGQRQVARPVDSEPTRRSAGVDGVAGTRQARPQEARERIRQAAYDRNPGRDPELAGGLCGQSSKKLTGADLRRQPIDRHAGGPQGRSVRNGLTDRHRRPGHARQPQADPLPGGQVPAGR